MVHAGCYVLLAYKTQNIGSLLSILTFVWPVSAQATLFYARCCICYVLLASAISISHPVMSPVLCIFNAAYATYYFQNTNIGPFWASWLLSDQHQPPCEASLGLAVIWQRLSAHCAVHTAMHIAQPCYFWRLCTWHPKIQAKACSIHSARSVHTVHT